MNMEGLILMGFCEADYEKLRNQMRISFVVYDGYFEKCSKVVNLVINHYDGGYQAGKYLKELGHEKALCIAAWIKSTSRDFAKPLNQEKY